MERRSTIFYRSFFETIKKLPPENQLEIYNAIFELSLNGKELELSDFSEIIFRPIKSKIKINISRFKNGKKGGRPRKNKQKENNIFDEKKLKPKSHYKSAIYEEKDEKNKTKNILKLKPKSHSDTVTYEENKKQKENNKKSIEKKLQENNENLNLKKLKPKSRSDTVTYEEKDEKNKTKLKPKSHYKSDDYDKIDDNCLIGWDSDFYDKKVKDSSKNFYKKEEEKKKEKEKTKERKEKEKKEKEEKKVIQKKEEKERKEIIKEKKEKKEKEKIKEEEKRQQKNNSIFEFDFSEKLEKAIFEFIDYRKKIKKPYKDLNRLFRSLKKQLISFSENEIIEAFETSMRNEYQGYFPKKEKYFGEKLPVIHDTDF